MSSISNEGRFSHHFFREKSSVREEKTGGSDLHPSKSFPLAILINRSTQFSVIHQASIYLWLKLGYFS